MLKQPEGMGDMRGVQVGFGMELPIGEERWGMGTPRCEMPMKKGVLNGAEEWGRSGNGESKEGGGCR